MPDTSPAVDPAMVADEQNVVLANLLYSGLVKLDSSYHIVPDSASSWTIGPDHRTYTFHLRRGLRFRNGDPVTAGDFVFSITRSLSPSLRSPSAPTYLADIAGASAMLSGKAKSLSGIEALDAYTLRITARWPVPYFLLELAYPTSFVLDAKQLRKLGSVDDSSWYTNPNGSGPYRLNSWTPNSKMILVPNARYAGPRPALHEIRISLAPLPSAGVYRSLSAAQDVATVCPPEKGLERASGIRQTNTLGITGIYMNMRRKPFRSGRVRRALALALNRSRIVSHSMGHGVTPFGGFVPPGEPGYDPDLRRLPYNTTAATASLASAGLPNGKRFPATTLYYADDPCNPNVGELAQQIATSWHRVLHIRIDTRGLTLNSLLTRAQTGTIPLYLGSWSANYPDPHDALSLQWESNALANDVRYRNRRFDQLAQTADVTWNVKQRSRLYAAAQQILVADTASIPLYVPHRLVFIRPSVVNLNSTGYGLIPRTGSWATVHVHIAAHRRRPVS